MDLSPAQAIPIFESYLMYQIFDLRIDTLHNLGNLASLILYGLHFLHKLLLLLKYSTDSRHDRCHVRHIHNYQLRISQH